MKALVRTGAAPCAFDMYRLRFYAPTTYVRFTFFLITTLLINQYIILSIVQPNVINDSQYSLIW